MFETLELGRQVKKKEFDKAVLELRQKLLKVQFELEDQNFPVIVIVSGVEGAGKGSVVHRLNEWMDPRGIETHAFWDTTDEEEQRPLYWRFWRAMPAFGRIGIFFGSWYTRPIIDRVFGGCDDHDLDSEMQRIEDFERMLTDDGAVIVKLWFHISEETQREQMNEDIIKKKLNLKIPEENAEQAKLYKKFATVCERAIRQTDTNHSPWHLIDAEDPNYRELKAGEILLNAMEQRLANKDAKPVATEFDSIIKSSQPTILDSVPTDAVVEPAEYKKELLTWQKRLQELAWQAREQKIGTVAVFEGWDAAGKGSAIRRVTQAIDPRLFHLIQFAAPTDEEKAHHYLWRFWRQVAMDGRFTLFDRSWYGRVLVERLEGFARLDEWKRAYNEINRFEEQIADHGSVVMKFWIHISNEEQLARFKLREETPHKQHKITDEDWRNREKWHDYEVAVHDMVTHTSTNYAPWTLVAGNDKRYARIQILKTFCDRLEARLAEAKEEK
jgi:polyphosphate:AMP phosphotransferase